MFIVDAQKRVCEYFRLCSAPPPEPQRSFGQLQQPPKAGRKRAVKRKAHAGRRCLQERAHLISKSAERGPDVAERFLPRLHNGDGGASVSVQILTLLLLLLLSGVRFPAGPAALNIAKLITTLPPPPPPSINPGPVEIRRGRLGSKTRGSDLILTNLSGCAGEPWRRFLPSNSFH